MLTVIKRFQKSHNKTVGFKASGGIRSKSDAADYIALGQDIVGKDWLSAKTFRLGASSLLKALVD
jgi:deoxyribose-phosphate aldolase